MDRWSRLKYALILHPYSQPLSGPFPCSYGVRDMVGRSWVIILSGTICALEGENKVKSSKWSQCCQHSYSLHPWHLYGLIFAHHSFTVTLVPDSRRWLVSWCQQQYWSLTSTTPWFFRISHSWGGRGDDQSNYFLLKRGVDQDLRNETALHPTAEILLVLSWAPIVYGAIILEVLHIVLASFSIL